MKAEKQRKIIDVSLEAIEQLKLIAEKKGWSVKQLMENTIEKFTKTKKQ